MILMMLFLARWLMRPSVASWRLAEFGGYEGGMIQRSDLRIAGQGPSTCAARILRRLGIDGGPPGTTSCD